MFYDLQPHLPLGQRIYAPEQWVCDLCVAHFAQTNINM